MSAKDVTVEDACSLMVALIEYAENATLEGDPIPQEVTDARAWIRRFGCPDHHFVSAVNERVRNGEICLGCGELRI